MQEGEWLDAQPFLRRVCADLRVGELLHGPSFSLFDSTVAIEIGDVKMDIGLHRENQEAGSAEELIAGGAAPVQLSPPLLLAVLDKLLCLEATWHTGSMLPQTVFTSLYMLHPDRLAGNAPLHAFCLALRSTCSVLVDMSHAGSVTSDEDLFVHTFGIRMLDLPGAKPVKAALQALAVAEEQLEQRVAAGDSSSISIDRKGSHQQQQQHKAAPQSGDAAAAAAASSSDGVLSGKQAAALLARIRFRRLLLEALQSLQLYSQAGIEQARRQCQLAEAQLDLLAGSASLAAPLEEAPSFVPDVNRRHMGMVPPRPLRATSVDQAVEHWRGLLRGLDSSLHSLLFVRGSWTALKATLTEFAAKNHHSIVRSAIHLQLIKPLPPPPPPAGPGAAPAAPSGGGAVAATTLLNGSSASSASPGVKAGKKPAAELPAWCPGHQMVCREFGLNPAALPGPEAELFVEQAAIAVQGQVYALCLNRCRQRRRLRRQLEDWRNIFDHGFNADVMPEVQEWFGRAGWRWTDQQDGLLQGQGPAATWAEREAACCALLHLQLGFPLELYAPNEHIQLYWYCHYLLDCQQRAGTYLHNAHPQPPPSLPAGKRGGISPGGRAGKPQRGGHIPSGGSGGGSSAGAVLGPEEQTALRELELLALDVERLMCQGMFRAAIGLQLLGCTAAPHTPFNSEEQRYEQRFGCLETLGRPEAVPFEHFQGSTDAGGMPPARVLGVAHANFQRAVERVVALLQTPQLRGLLREEQVRHLEGTQRSATQNAVAVKLLAATSARAAADAAAGGQPEGQARPAPFQAAFDFKTALASSTAHFYPAIVLKR